MKKLVVIGLTALTVAGVVPPVETLAADCKVITVTSKYNAGNLNCDVADDIRECIESGKLSNSCIKWGMIKFDNLCPDNSEDEETETPEVEVPEVETPEIPNQPDIDIPETPEQPDNGITEEQPPVTTPEVSDYARQVVDLVNMERQKEGLSPLTIDTVIASAATVRAREIQTSFSHTRPNGSNFSTAMTEAGANFQMAGENIAWGQKTPQEVVNAWMNSPSHRANIMNKNFTRIGVGHVQNASGTSYWVQLFAK